MTKDKADPADSIKALEGGKPPLNWEGGKREPPSNRGVANDPSLPGHEEAPNGDRGEASGRNLEQEAQVSRKPGKAP